jgi:hypothetical protein
MSRIIKDLRWARVAPEQRKAGRTPSRGAKAAGIRYERALAKALPQALPGLWWEFEDYKGWGTCQTDLVLRVHDQIFVLEAKYTWTESAWPQLENLYLPVLGMATEMPVWGIQVCKNLTPCVRGMVCRKLHEALESAANGHMTTLHWIEKGAV